MPHLHPLHRLRLMMKHSETDKPRLHMDSDRTTCPILTEHPFHLVVVVAAPTHPLTQGLLQGEDSGPGPSQGVYWAIYLEVAAPTHTTISPGHGRFGGMDGVPDGETAGVPDGETTGAQVGEISQQVAGVQGQAHTEVVTQHQASLLELGLRQDLGEPVVDENPLKDVVRII